MAAKLIVVASALLVAVAPFAASSPVRALPVSLQSNLGAQKNMDIHLPEGATSVTADTINNLSIVFADTVYILADGSVVPENPTTTTGLPPLSTTAATPPANGGGTGSPVITPPTFPGRK
uniref:Uncharacterized protein n=2 Tax=gambiae species complex TaxID=44542 RepID=A0A240PLR6_ANOGA